MIKEHISKIQRGDCSKTEVTLTGICLVLAGIVLGMKLAPFRVSTFGKERKEFDEVPENFTYDREDAVNDFEMAENMLKAWEKQ